MSRIQVKIKDQVTRSWLGKFALKMKRDRKFANVFRDFVTLNEDLRILMFAIVSSPERFLLCDRDVLLQVAPPPSSSLLSLPGSPPPPSFVLPMCVWTRRKPRSRSSFQDKQINLLISSAATPLDFVFIVFISLSHPCRNSRDTAVFLFVQWCCKYLLLSSHTAPRKAAAIVNRMNQQWTVYLLPLPKTVKSVVRGQPRPQDCWCSEISITCALECRGTLHPVLYWKVCVACCDSCSA